MEIGTNIIIFYFILCIFELAFKDLSSTVCKTNNNAVGTTKPLQNFSCVDGVVIPFNDTATHNEIVWKIYLLFKVRLIFGPASVTRPRRLKGCNVD